jgi:hypothetical protein
MKSLLLILMLTVAYGPSRGQSGWWAWRLGLDGWWLLATAGHRLCNMLQLKGERIAHNVTAYLTRRGRNFEAWR